MEILVDAYGPVPPGVGGYARNRLRLVEARAASRVWSVRVRLVQLVGPGIERPALAHGSVTMRGPRVEAHASGTTMFEAVDRLQERLVQQVDRPAGPAARAASGRSVPG